MKVGEVVGSLQVGLIMIRCQSKRSAARPPAHQLGCETDPPLLIEDPVRQRGGAFAECPEAVDILAELAKHEIASAEAEITAAAVLAIRGEDISGVVGGIEQRARG